MKIKLLISRAGAGFVQAAGDVIDVSEREAEQLIKQGDAEPVTSKETAVRKMPTRKAVKD